MPMLRMTAHSVCQNYMQPVSKMATWFSNHTFQILLFYEFLLINCTFKMSLMQVFVDRALEISVFYKVRVFFLIILQ